MRVSTDHQDSAGLPGLGSCSGAGGNQLRQLFRRGAP